MYSQRIIRGIQNESDEAEQSRGMGTAEQGTVLGNGNNSAKVQTIEKNRDKEVWNISSMGRVLTNENSIAMNRTEHNNGHKAGTSVSLQCNGKSRAMENINKAMHTLTKDWKH
jgi:hypothetical protein